MKQITALLICFVLLLQLTGCRSSVDNMLSSTETVTSTAKQTETAEADTGNSKNTDTSATGRTVVEETISIPAITSTQTTPTDDTSAESDYSDYKVFELEEVEEAVEPNKFSGEVWSVSEHTALSENFYYQYSFLSDTEKKVYLELVQAVKNGETILDLSTYGCSVDSAGTIFASVICDYPQFFYLAKSFGYTNSARKNTIKQFIIIYFDGKIKDQYNEKGKLTISADRSLINQQIQAFNSKVSKIIGNIPANASNLEKEKLIYEYLQDTIVYDSNAAATVTNASAINCHAFDAYGAACEGLAVCEGYAELFQYLCYCVNINATQVCGTASGGSHMWNAVCLDSEWYMVDATWDDSAKEGLHCYGYFNITGSEISADHTIDYETVHVPICSATTYAFYNWYALYVSSSSKNPINYENVIDYLVKNNEKYLCVYIDNLSGSKQSYIQKYILSSKSDLQQYISSKAYNLSFYSTYYTIGNYCYIPLK